MRVIKCGNCKHLKKHLVKIQGKWLEEYICTNKDSVEYGIPVFDDDDCSEWEGKDGERISRTDSCKGIKG